VERSTGEAWIENLSDKAVIFDGYNIVSAAQLLDAVHWRSFQDWTSSDPISAFAVLGNASWGEFNKKPDNLVEVNITRETTAAPGFRVSLGLPIGQVVEGDLQFFFSDYSKPPAMRNTVGEVRLVDTPAPAAGVLALWALPGLLLARRRLIRR